MAADWKPTHANLLCRKPLCSTFYQIGNVFPIQSSETLAAEELQHHILSLSKSQVIMILLIIYFLLLLVS